MFKFTGFCFFILSLAGCATTSVDKPAPSNKSTAALPSTVLRPSYAPYPIISGYQVSSDTVQVQYTVSEHHAIGVYAALMKEYHQWAGTPYVFGGEGREGIDCSALMQHVFREQFNYTLPRTASEQMKKGRRISRAALKPGDLVFFKPARRSHHVGIYLGNGLFMHASSSQGVMISELSSKYWSRRYIQARRPLEQAQLASRTGESLSRTATFNG